jgi:septation ring formation regulator EzrA
MNFFKENFITLMGYISAVLVYIFTGRPKAKQDAVTSMKIMYDDFLIIYKDRMSEVMLELSEMRTHNRELQNKFNDIQLSYAKEIEVSQNWERLHRELEAKYNKLQSDYDKLKLEVNKLKKGI